MSNRVINLSDRFSVEDKVAMYDKVIYDNVSSYLPEVLKKSQWKSFSDILAELCTEISISSSDILYAYSLDRISDNNLPRIANKLFNIEYPSDYGLDKLRLLLKVYPFLRKIRGSRKAIILLFRILERSEKDLYSGDIEDVSIAYDKNGLYQVVYDDRIKNLKFARYMLTKIVRAGIGVTVIPKSYQEREYIFDHVVEIGTPFSVTSKLDSILLSYDEVHGFRTDTGEAYFMRYEYSSLSNNENSEDEED